MFSSKALFARIVLDTNSNPDGIDYPIPGNDDARRSIDLYCSLLNETIQNAKKEIPQSVVNDKEIKETKNDSITLETTKENKVDTKVN